jgi:N-acetylmuramoyl-L-alanine amidase
MTRLTHVLPLLLLGLSLLVSPVRAQGLSPSAEQLYADASAKEAAVRKALAAPRPAITVLRAVRTVVLDYEAMARRHPTSPYGDDALWKGALLASDAYRLFRDPHEQRSAVTMLRLLVAQYPTSTMARQTPALIAELSVLAPKGGVTFERTDKAALRPPTAPAAAAPSKPLTAAPATTRALASDSTPPPGAKPLAPQRQPVSARAAAATPIATISDIRRVALTDVVRVIIELDREVSFRDERLANPDRVFLDLPRTSTTRALRDQTLRFDGDADPVRQIRLGRHPNDTTRVVLETDAISSYSVYALYNPFRLVIDCLREQPADLVANAAVPSAPPLPAPASAPVPVKTAGVVPVVNAAAESAAPMVAPARAVSSPAPASDALAALPPFPTPAARPRALVPLTPRRVEPWSRVTPALSSNESVIRDATEIVAPEPPPPAPVTTAAVAVLPTAPVPPIEPASRMLSGGFSLARQLGMSASRIVIDPGHGGHDPGAKGGGLNEADLVLDVALRLEKLFQATPDTEVILTRRTDAYVTLQERTAIANREAADLFLSIHANASNTRSARGVETYFLNFANNLSAAATAARENAAAGQAMGELPDVVKTIALNNKLQESKDFATYVQREMVARLGSGRNARDIGVKQAPFQVLIGASMPSILSEIAFLTNAQEARSLKQAAHRQKIAEALFNAVRKYQRSLSHGGSAIAQQ